MWLYIYIYIERERERERYSQLHPTRNVIGSTTCVCVCVRVHVSPSLRRSLSLSLSLPLALSRSLNVAHAYTLVRKVHTSPQSTVYIHCTGLLYQSVYTVYILCSTVLLHTYYNKYSTTDTVYIHCIYSVYTVYIQCVYTVSGLLFYRCLWTKHSFYVSLGHTIQQPKLQSSPRMCAFEADVFQTVSWSGGTFFQRHQ